MTKSWTAHRIAVCLLGILLSLGMGLSVVQAGQMAAQMALAGDMDASGDDGCGYCDGGDAAELESCVTNCAAPTFTLPEPAGFASMAELSVTFPNRTEPLRGTAHSPDPHPPRPIRL